MRIFTKSIFTFNNEKKYTKFNKKGFTLIELLAVIVILTFIALVTVPLVTDIIEDSQKKTLKSSAYGLVEAAKIYRSENMLDGKEIVTTTFKVIDNKMVDEKGDELLFKGDCPKGDSWVTIAETGEVSLNITDGKYYVAKGADDADIKLTETEGGSLTREELTTAINELNRKYNNLTDSKSSENIFLKAYPIGSIYTSITSTNPGEIFGGTWISYANGRTLVGVDTTQNEFKTVEFIGGEKSHLLTISEMPTHQHESPFPGNAGGNGSGFFGAIFGSGRTSAETGAKTELYNFDVSNAAEGNELHPYVSESGGSQAHNNLQPYITVYMWKRTK